MNQRTFVLRQKTYLRLDPAQERTLRLRPPRYEWQDPVPENLAPSLKYETSIYQGS